MLTIEIKGVAVIHRSSYIIESQYSLIGAKNEHGFSFRMNLRACYFL